MASQRTPVTGLIGMNDIGETLDPNGIFTPYQMNIQDISIRDFNDSPTPGLAFCYGPGAGQTDLNSYHDMLGYVNYVVKATNVRGANTIVTTIEPANGSNGLRPDPLPLDVGLGTLPDGEYSGNGAHWATVLFFVEASGVTGPFDVYFDGTYIDTITSDGSYMYDNGGPGYTNGYGTGNEVYIDFIG